ncbi:hypothetical protein THMIRHAS_03850 [Thiosulfatimonas sediminis]|uniref:Uncharacterized protein n=1 Tax=Thiosulfatimonas sediminis TaxID=2675054 RepID=A0A6F8PSA2_9GAMM|nr:hypothetical protein [Thiosulfatimonas sediminis]BBP45012.1 hypothetical protein THMIRHAS_03850 [Thiosulfatimonas sediminis]
MATYLLESLHPRPKAASITSLTKNSNTQCHASNLAFFVPKIRAILSAMGMENRNRISKYGRVKGRIKDLFEGNKSSRVTAISDTRPPATKTGGNTKTVTEAYHMANSSFTRETVGQFSFSINLPENSFIKRFIAVSLAGAWSLSIETESGQIATIQNHATKSPRYFETLDSLAIWLASQGVPQMQVMLPNAVTVGGAE